MKKLWGQVIILLMCQHAVAQPLPDCSGQNFRVLEERGGTVLQQITLDASSGNYQFNTLKKYPGRRLNAISHYTRDGFIYGFDIDEGLTLFKILADYTLLELKQVNVPGNLFFVAADIDQINNYLYVLGYSMEEPEALLLRIGLALPDYPVEYLPVFGSNSPACADLVYQPATQSLLGFDHKNQSLVEFRIFRNRAVVNPLMHSDLRIDGGIPSLFFDQRSGLVGIGFDQGSTNYRVYHFSLSNGLVNIQQTLTPENNQDACSCLNPLVFTNRISQVENSSCHALEFNLNLRHLKNEGLNEVMLQNDFPANLRIVGMESETTYEVMAGGIGFNYFELQFRSLTQGDLNLKIHLEILDNSLDTVFLNQAIALINQDTLFSDDPRTLLASDSTRVLIQPEINISKDVELTFCQGDTLALRPEIPADLTYEWSTGDILEIIRVDQPGLYRLKAEGECTNYFFNYWIEESTIEIELGGPIEVEEFEKIEIKPQLFDGGTDARYFWTSDNSRIEFCATCRSQNTLANEDFTLGLRVVNEDGCSDSDTKEIAVKPLRWYEPNAFTPNGDGINDEFQLYSNRDFLLQDFQIFNRWGEIVFEQPVIKPSEQISWDGRMHGQLLNPGVYLWKATIIRKNGSKEQTRGEVVLVN